jgi:YbbR domain-containing protein
VTERANGRGRLWGLRMVALALAIGLWFGISLSNRDVTAEKVVETTISYVRPEGLILMNPPTTVKVTVSGPESEVRTLIPYLVYVQVSLEGAQPGLVKKGLSAENVTLPDPKLTVISIDPNVVNLDLDRSMTKTLPLEAFFSGEPAAGARVLMDKVVIDPPNATVTGPARILEGIDKLDLSPISLEGHAIDFTQTVSILTPDPLVQVGRSRVQVEVPMELGLGTGESGSSPGGGGSGALGGRLLGAGG